MPRPAAAGGGMKPGGGAPLGPGGMKGGGGMPAAKRRGVSVFSMQMTFGRA